MQFICVELSKIVFFEHSNNILSNTQFEASTLKIAPNPVNSSFSINRAVTNVKIVDITGKLVKEFNGDFESNKSYDISQLPQSMYIVQISFNLLTRLVLKNFSFVHF